MSDYTLSLDPTKRSSDTIDFQAALRSKIVGQEEAVQALVDLYQVFRAGLNSPGRPVGNLLFLGPTGSGKRSEERRVGKGGRTRWTRCQQDKARQSDDIAVGNR